MIEHLKIEDIESALDVGEEVHLQSCWNNISFDREYSDNYVRLLLNKPQYGFILVYKINNVIVGGIVAVVNNYPFSTEQYSDVYILFIKEEHRKGRAAIELIKAYIEEAKKYKVKEINIGCNSPTMKEQVEKLYEHVG